MVRWFTILAVAASCRPAIDRGPPAAPSTTVARDRSGGSEATPNPNDRDPFVPLTRIPGSTFVEIAEARALADGRLLYCTAVRGLQVVDATDPAAPQAIAAILPRLGNPRFGGCQHLAVDGNRVYVTNRGHGNQRTPFVAAIALDGELPREIAAYRSPGRSFEGIAARGSRVYVAMHDAGLGVLDATDEALTERSIIKGPLESAWDVELSNDLLYVTDARGALVIFDIGHSPQVVGRVETEGTAQAVAVVNKTAYIAAGAAGLVTVDVSNPAIPRVVSTLDTPGSAVEIAATEQHVFLADWESVRVYDITEPHHPRVIATQRIKTKKPFSRVLSIAARGHHAFIGEWTGMYTYELRPDRAAPAIVLDRATVDFGKRAGTERIAVENHGRAPLKITKLTTEGSVFSVGAESMVVAPSELRFIDLAYHPGPVSTPVTGALIVDSDDPDDPSVKIPLTACAEGLSVGATAPEVELELLDGGEWRLSEHRGKTVLLAYFATF